MENLAKWFSRRPLAMLLVCLFPPVWIIGILLFIVLGFIAMTGGNKTAFGFGLYMILQSPFWPFVQYAEAVKGRKEAARYRAERGE